MLTQYIVVPVVSFCPPLATVLRGHDVGAATFPHVKLRGIGLLNVVFFYMWALSGFIFRL